MSFKAELYFTAEAVRLARYFISQNDGNEIVMVGKVDPDGKVCDLRRTAMGDSGSVPAVIATASPGEILIHNHPNGIAAPSADDVAATREIFAFLEKLNVRLVNHIILSEDGYCSMIDKLKFVHLFHAAEPLI